MSYTAMMMTFIIDPMSEVTIFCQAELWPPRAALLRYPAKPLLIQVLLRGRASRTAGKRRLPDLACGGARLPLPLKRMKPNPLRLGTSRRPRAWRGIANHTRLPALTYRALPHGHVMNDIGTRQALLRALGHCNRSTSQVKCSPLARHP